MAGWAPAWAVRFEGTSHHLEAVAFYLWRVDRPRFIWCDLLGLLLPCRRCRVWSTGVAGIRRCVRGRVRCPPRHDLALWSGRRPCCLSFCSFVLTLCLCLWRFVPLLLYLFVLWRSAAYRFLFDGNRVNDQDTPESLEMVRFASPVWLSCVVRATPLRCTEARCYFHVGALAVVSGPRCIRHRGPQRGACNRIACVCRVPLC